MTNKEIAMLELRGDRLILIQKFGKMNASQVEVDVTGVWHFFRDYQEYLSTPLDKPSNKKSGRLPNCVGESWGHTGACK